MTIHHTINPPKPDRVPASRAEVRAALSVKILNGAAPTVLESFNPYDPSQPCMADVESLGLATKYYIHDRSRPPEITGWYWIYTGPHPITVPPHGIIATGAIVGDAND